MTLETLFKKRHSLYLKELLKYGRYIINDHFVLILFLLIGVGGYTYQGFLDTLTLGMLGPRILLFVIFFLFTSTGNVTLLLEGADEVFLLPKERAFRPIFKEMTTRSYLQSLISLIVITFITFPIFVLTKDASTIDSLFIFLTLASLKGLNLLLKIFPFFISNREQGRKYKLGLFVLKIITLFSLFFIHIKITAVLISVVAVYLAFLFVTEKMYFNHFFKWETMIAAEERRLQGIYRFIEMFVTVPKLETRIHRLPWLDHVLNWLSVRYPEAPYYYVLRIVSRNAEYSLLVLRVILVGGILLAVTDVLVVSLILVLLFIYMIGFQLLSLLNEIERLPQFRMYPITKKVKTESVLRVIREILVLASVFLAFSSIWAIGIYGILLLIVGISFSYLFSVFYAPRRLNKIKFEKRT